MNHGISQECLVSERHLRNELQEFLSRDDLPRKVIFGMDEHNKGWETIDKICGSLEWRLLPSKVGLDPGWQRPGWWCDGVGFLLLEIPSRNELRGFGYSYWVDDAGKAWGTEPIEVELKLVELDQPPQLDYSIKLWAGGLLHQYTPSGIAIALPFDEQESVIEPYLEALISIINNKEIEIRQRLIAAELLEKFLSPNALRLSPPFHRMMNDPDVDVRRIAASRLATDLPPHLVAPYAIQALNDSDRYVRAFAVIALWRSALDDGEVQELLSHETPLLLEMLTGECSDPSYRKFKFCQAAADVLSMISRKYKDGRAAIIKALEEKGMTISVLHLPILIGFGTADETVVEFLERVLNGQDMSQRQWAAFHYWALGIDDGRLFRTVQREGADSRGTRKLTPSPATRYFFEMIPAERALPGLFSIVADSDVDPQMWCQAIGALATIAAEEKYFELRPVLKSKIPLLTELLDHPEYRIVKSAAESLGLIGADAATAVTALIQIVKDESQYLYKRSSAAEALAKFKLDPATAVSLFELLAGQDEYPLYSNAIPVISHLGAEAVPIVVKALQLREDDGTLEFFAFEFLDQLGPAAVSGLVELSKTEPWKERAISLLGKTRSAEAVPHLIDLLKHETRQRRAEAAEALGRLGEIAAPAIPALSSQLTDHDIKVTVRAIEALGRIGRRSAPALIEAIDRIDNADEFILCWLTKALGETEEREAIPYLQGYLSHPDPEVRYFAGEALTKLSQII